MKSVAAITAACSPGTAIVDAPRPASGFDFVVLCPLNRQKLGFLRPQRQIDHHFLPGPDCGAR